MTEDFCKILKDATAHCARCTESNSRALCDIKLAEQAIIGKKFQLYDTVMILRGKRGGVYIETDISIPYTASHHYEYDHDAFLFEMDIKKNLLTRKLREIVPDEVSILRYHEHHYPNVDPWRVGLHTHLHYRATDIKDAARVAKYLVKIINPKELSKFIQED